MKDDDRTMADDTMAHDEEQRLLDMLRELPLPEAEQGFYDRALYTAARDGARRQRNRWIMTGFASASAAAIVILLVSGIIPGANMPAPDDQAIPGITISMAGPDTVNLVFASAEALEDATLTLVLPEGVELDGFPGKREIRWRTSLAAGRNLLPLDLVAVTPVGGEVVATLTHETRTRTFRLHVSVG